MSQTTRRFDDRCAWDTEHTQGIALSSNFHSI
jgi:hypothetical protein